MTFTGLVGCGRNENKQVTPEPTNTTTTETVGNSETSEVSDVTDEVVVVDVDITQYPWVLSHEFSEEKYLTLPAGAKFCGIDLPISKETIYSIPYSNHAFDSIEAAKDSPARNLSFRVEDSTYPNLLLDASEFYGDNVVSELVAERKNAFGNVEFLGPDPAVQDIMQDTYITALTHMQQLENPERIIAWLNRIAINKCKAFLSKYMPEEFREEMVERDVL